MSGTYLPPVVISVIANDSLFVKTLTKDQALLKAFAKNDANVVLNADSTPMMDGLAKARVALLAFAKEAKSMQLGANAAPFWAEIATLRTQLAAMSPLDINVDANTSAAMAQIAALRGTMALAKVGTMIPASAAAGGGGSTARGGVAGLLAGLLGGGGSGGGGSILSLLGFGTGKGIAGFGAGLPAFGTIGSLLGLGAEHFAAMGLGVGGSAVGALAGGGLLGLAAGATMGVGGLTDMAGIGQAGNDIRAVEQAQNALNKAMAVYKYDVANYGAASATATAALQNMQAAQANVNFTLSQVPAVAQGAVLATANTIQAFKTMFDNLSGPAEKIGAQILQQAVQVGMAFLPTIGKYAAENMGIIEKDIQPLFSWLKSNQGGGKGFLQNLMGGNKVGGLAIFTNLEQVFQKNLPNAISAFTQALQFIGKTADVAAQKTGSFISSVAKFFTHMNSQKAFSGWAGTVDRLIGLFRTWLHLAITVGKTVYDIFKPAVGAGQALVRMLTGALNVLDKWLTTASNAKALHNLFSAHLVELVKGFGSAIGAAIPLLLDIGKGFIPVLTIGAKVGTLVFRPIAWALREIAKIPFAAQVAGWAGSLFLLSKALGGLKMTNVTGLFRSLASRINNVVSAAKLLPTRFGLAKIAVQDFGSTLFASTGAMLGVIGGFAVLGGAAVLWALSMKSSYQKAEAAGKQWAQGFANSVTQSTLPLGTQISVIKQKISDLNGALVTGLSSWNTSSGAIAKYRSQYASTQGKVTALKSALAGLESTQASQNAQLNLATGTNSSYANSMSVLSAATSGVNSAMSTYSGYLDQLAGIQQTVTGLTLTMASDLNQITSATAKGTVSLNGNNSASVTLQQNILSMAQTLEGQLMPAWAKQGKTVPQITADAQHYIDKLNLTLKALGYTPGAIAAMDSKMGLVPSVVDPAAKSLAKVAANANLATKAAKNLTQQPWTVKVNNTQALSALQAIGSAVQTDLAGLANLANAQKLAAGAAAGLQAGSTIAGTMPYLGQLSGLSGHSMQISNNNSVVIHAGGSNPGQTAAAVQQAIDSSNSKLMASLRAGNAYG